MTDAHLCRGRGTVAGRHAIVLQILETALLPSILVLTDLGAERHWETRCYYTIVGNIEKNSKEWFESKTPL
jgi:hypothetical protein